MPLAAGVATSGKSGALVVQDYVPVTRAIPVANFSPSVAVGDSVIELINNSAYAANVVAGLAIGSFSWSGPYIPAVTNAAFFTKAFLNVAGDTDAANYHELTLYPDNAGSAAVVYALCKFARWTGSVSFSASGRGAAVGMGFSGMCLDPESGSAAALAAPAAGALSVGGIKGYGDTVITGASEVVSVAWDVSTQLSPTPGLRAGTNTSYPHLVKGLLQNGIGGTVRVTQYRNATTVLGAGATPQGTLTLAIGTTGSGASFAFELRRVGNSKPATMGVNLMTTTYQLLSIDGTTSPVVVTDL